MEPPKLINIEGEYFRFIPGCDCEKCALTKRDWDCMDLNCEFDGEDYILVETEI